jgi:hypothetical protein
MVTPTAAFFVGAWLFFFVENYSGVEESYESRFGVEQPWQGDFLFLALSFSWMHYAGAENRKGVEGSY